MTVRLDRLQRGLSLALAGVAATVLWAYSEVSHEQLLAAGDDFVELRLISGPIFHLAQHARGEILLPADSVLVRVTGATAGTLNIARLNGFDYRYETQAGDSFTDIRDSLLADIQAGEVGSVTATADGADGIQLAGDFLGGLRRLSLLGELSSDPAVFSGDAVLETIGTTRSLVTVTAYSQSGQPRDGATFVASKALAELQKHSTVDTLNRYGLAIWDKGQPTNQDAIAGAHWESRSGFDLTVAAKSVAIDPVEQIENLELTLTAS